MDFAVGFIAASLIGAYVILGLGGWYLYKQLKGIREDIYEVELELYDSGGGPDDGGGLDIPVSEQDTAPESKILAFTRTGKKAA